MSFVYFCGIMDDGSFCFPFNETEKKKVCLGGIKRKKKEQKRTSGVNYPCANVCVCKKKEKKLCSREASAKGEYVCKLHQCSTFLCINRPLGFLGFACQYIFFV